MTNDQAPRIRVEIVDEKAASWWSKLILFINSPAFLTFAAFILTGLLGAYISDMISDNQHRADQLAAEFKDRETLWNAQETTINDSMNDRLADAKLVDSAIANDDSSEEIAQRWTHYQESYRLYEVNNVQNSSALRVFAGSSMDVGQLMDDDRANAFTWYKDIITARFALLDTCLTRAHKTYLAQADAAAKLKRAGSAKPLDILTNCDMGMTDANERKVSRVAAKLSTCISSYNTELNGVMRMKRGIVGERIIAETNPRRYFPWSDVTKDVKGAKSSACANYELSEARLKTACPELSEELKDKNRAGALALECETEIVTAHTGK